MRFKQYNGNGYGLSGLTPAGGVISAPLYLTSTFTNPMHAVTKEYVDHALSSVVGNMIIGDIPADRLPVFTGTDVSSNGYGIFTIKNSGVTAGTYNKVTVNSKGFVVSGEISDYSVLTDIPWASITQNKPVTLEGYGITDALRTTGGTMSGALLITSAPSQPKHLVNKGYVDSIIAIRETQDAGKIGEIIQTTESVTPVNYLRTNGAILDQASYAALYAIIGERYGTVIEGGAVDYIGQPWRQQYAFNTASHDAALTWTTGTSPRVKIQNSQAIVTKNRVYLIGGIVDGSRTGGVDTAPINANGTLGAWTYGPDLPLSFSDSQAIITKNRIYLLGGSNGNPSDKVYTAPINADGTIGTWTTGDPLLTGIRSHRAFVTKNRVYLFGGVVSSGGYSAAVYTAPINADGVLGAWTTSTPLPDVVRDSQVIVTKNRVYLLGGSFSDIVYTAPINTDGTIGTWTIGTPLPTVLGGSQAIVTKDRAYLLGGEVRNVESDIVYTAPINGDGTLGTWTTGTPLPLAISQAQAVVTQERIYVLGGLTSNDNTSDTIYSSSFAGGLNDYMTPIVNNVANPTTQFKLPDTSLTDPDKLYSYIKYV